MLKGLIYGFVNRAKSLCTNPRDRLPFIAKSYYRLLARGYQTTTILPIFDQAIKRVLHGDTTTDQVNLASTKTPLLLHLHYNPSNPSSKLIQRAFNETVLSPPNAELLSNIKTDNAFNGKADFDRLTICYNGQPNLGNSISPRKHNFGTDFLVSSFLQKNFPETLGP